MSGSNLPEGVVTFVFTDIEGSTRLLQELGSEYVSILETHRSVLRQVFAGFEGREVNTEGDGFFAAFASPSSAVLAAVRAQRDLAGEPALAQHGVRVRIGMNTGEAQRTGHDYVGLAVHQAARVANAGHGGQVLVADSTRLLAGDPPGVEFDDLGEHVLKDFAGAVRIFQVHAEGIRSQFPRIRSLNSLDASLPVARTSFIGRAKELNAVLSELADPGLVTLTGAGGTGKTRLAIETAREIRASMDGAWFVDLQPITEPREVLDAAAAALGVLEPGDPTAVLHRLAERIEDRPCLVVLDNCEHVLTGAAHLVDKLLDRCPALRILATSRDLLGIPGERAHRVPPLDASSGAALFLDRARHLVPSFDPDGDERRQIDEVCRRLDGIPLAIELAAARVRHMSVEDLAARIEDVFEVVVGSQGRELQRHQTLQALVDWSYELLSVDEQIVFRRLSVLGGDFTVSAAEAVADGDPLGAPVAATLFRLVDRSLIEHNGAGRYWQLKILRAYGRTKLQASGELEITADRHMSYFLDYAEDLAPRLRKGDFFDAVDQLESEARNLWIALQWADGKRYEDPSVLRLLAATVEYAAVTGRAQYIDVAEAALEARGEHHPDLRVVGHVAFAVAATTMGWDHLRWHANTALELLGDEGDEPHPDDELRAWTLASVVLLDTSPGGDGKLTRGYAERAKALALRCHLPLVGIGADAAMAWELMRADEVAAAREILDEVRAVGASDLRGSLWFAGALFRAAIAAMRARDWETAIELYREVLPFFRRVRRKLYAQWVLDHLSEATLQFGDFSAARAYAEEGITISLAAGLGPFGNIAHLYARLASLESLREDHERAVQYYEQAMAVTRENDLHDQAALRSNLAAEMIQCGDVDGARAHIEVAIGVTEHLAPLTLPNGAVYPPPVSNAVHAVARLALASGRPMQAAELVGSLLEQHPMETASPATRQRMSDFRDAIAKEVGDSQSLSEVMERGKALERPLDRARQILESLR